MRYKQENKTQTKICEICGAEFIAIYGFALGATWHVTGHYEGIPSYNCQSEETAQHWGCTPEHAIEALIICLQDDDHMGAGTIHKKHREAQENGHRKVEPGHEYLLQRGERFHIIREGEYDSGKSDTF